MAARVLGKRVAAVLGWVAVEDDVDSVAGDEGGALRDALDDVDAVVVALAPGYFILFSC